MLCLISQVVQETIDVGTETAAALKEQVFVFSFREKGRLYLKEMFMF